MGGLSAGAADSTVLVPSAATTVVSRLLSHGLSASPGRHSQTVLDEPLAGEAVAAGDAVAAGEAVVDGDAVARADAAADGDAADEDDESSHEMPTTAVKPSPALRRIAPQACRARPLRRSLDCPIIAPTSLRMFTYGVVWRWYSHLSTRLQNHAGGRTGIIS